MEQPSLCNVLFSCSVQGGINGDDDDDYGHGDGDNDYGNESGGGDGLAAQFYNGEFLDGCSENNPIYFGVTPLHFAAIIFRPDQSQYRYVP